MTSETVEQLEDRVLQSLLIGMFSVPLLIFLINLIMGPGTEAAFAAGFAAFVFLIIYLAYRRLGDTVWIRRTAVLALLLLVIPPTFVTNAGLDGGFGYFVLMFGLIVVSITREGRERVWFSVLYAVILIALVLGDLTFLRELYPEISVVSLRFKRAYSLLISAATVYILFQIYASRYLHEHRRLMESQVEIEKYNEELFRQARIDSLTGVPNRRDGIERVQALLEIAERNDREFALLLCDMDLFKSFNDEYGHDCGDYLLREVAQEMKRTIRAQDFVARWGGEEFLIVLPETGISGTAELAEKLRSHIEHHEFVHAGVRHNLTLTIGFTARNGSRIAPLDEYLKEADRALYFGKESGRNRIVSAASLADQKGP